MESPACESRGFVLNIFIRIWKNRFGLSEEEFEELLLAGGVSDSGKKGEEPKLSYRKEAITRMPVI